MTFALHNPHFLGLRCRRIFHIVCLVGLAAAALDLVTPRPGFAVFSFPEDASVSVSFFRGEWCVQRGRRPPGHFHPRKGKNFQVSSRPECPAGHFRGVLVVEASVDRSR